MRFNDENRLACNAVDIGISPQIYGLPEVVYAFLDEYLCTVGGVTGVVLRTCDLKCLVQHIRIIVIRIIGIIIGEHEFIVLVPQCYHI